jgi:hypothetical protein
MGGSSAGGALSEYSGGGSPSSGGSKAVGSSLGTRVDPCSLPGAFCAVGPEPWAECGQRGGACLNMTSTSSQCPSGTYNPFADRYCPTGARSRCCVPTGDLGSPCDASNPCEGRECLNDASNYPIGGVCASGCSQDDCPASGVCVAMVGSQAPGLCLVACTNDWQCRNGQNCQAFPSTPITSAVARYACWAKESPYGKGLGDLCSGNSDCLSQHCRPDPAGTNRCTARCNAANPCLTGFKCETDLTCSSTICGLCFPT